MDLANKKLTPEEVEKRLLEIVNIPAGGKVLRTAMREGERVFWVEMVDQK